MPELPEVETVVRTLRPLLVGRRLTGVEWPSLRNDRHGRTILRRLLNDSPAQLQKALCGARVEGIERRGKNILIRLRRDEPGGSGAALLLIHLGMTGRLQFERVPEPLRPHTHAVFHLDAPDRWLHFSDPRRFGRLRLLRGPAADLEKLGPDPLEIVREEFTARVRARRAMLKSLLLDQRFLSGLGNIYADETLSRARLHPAAIGARLTRRQAAALHQAMGDVLREAIALGGSSISDYADAEGRQGWFQQEHQVYGRQGEPCFRCGTRIRRIIIASRSTHYCPRCQRAGKPRPRAFAPPRRELS
ncbi:MAG TPA: bifunctional DNA-formamidopyrimidine glycosylase/DNA-(apurinic or apyrimidinic site) lyase [Terriglobia bacterium]|nr:bifunctional DNA-formamidopyrimidine glycosylase/DNA-(apurinic or apyrimidinic site) lyase [Terriglobia bacterium]